MPQEPGELDTDGMAIMASAIALEGYTFADFAGFDEKALEPAYALAFNMINQSQFYEAEKLLVWLAGLDQYQANTSSASASAGSRWVALRRPSRPMPWPACSR